MDKRFEELEAKTGNKFMSLTDFIFEFVPEYINQIPTHEAIMFGVALQKAQEEGKTVMCIKDIYQVEPDELPVGDNFVMYTTEEFSNMYGKCCGEEYNCKRKALEGFVRNQWAKAEKDLLDLSHNKKYRGDTPEQFERVLSTLHNRLLNSIPFTALNMVYCIDNSSLTIRRQSLSKAVTSLTEVIDRENLAATSKSDYILNMHYDFAPGVAKVDVTMKKAEDGLYKTGKTFEEDYTVDYTFVCASERDCVVLMCTEICDVNYSIGELMKAYPGSVPPIKKWEIIQNGEYWERDVISRKGKETDRSFEISSHVFNYID